MDEMDVLSDDVQAYRDLGKGRDVLFVQSLRYGMHLCLWEDMCEICA